MRSKLVADCGFNINKGYVVRLMIGVSVSGTVAYVVVHCWLTEGEQPTGRRPVEERDGLLWTGPECSGTCLPSYKSGTQGHFIGGKGGGSAVKVDTHLHPGPVYLHSPIRLHGVQLCCPQSVSLSRC
jgi:hypothetical protein